MPPPLLTTWITCRRRRPISGQFVVHGKELPTAYVRTKFEGLSFIRLRNIGTLRCAALIDPVTLTFDLLTLKSVWELHVTWGTPVQSFVFLGLLVDVRDIRQTDRQTDRQMDRQTDNGRRSSLNAPPPPPLRSGGIIMGLSTSGGKYV